MKAAPIATHFLPLLLSCIFDLANAQSLASCSPSVTPTNSIRPSVASGYQAAVVATGLNKPRSLLFDSAGNLLIIESGKGLTRYQIEGTGACASLKNGRTVVNDRTLNHGLTISQDGRKLYASNPSSAYEWDYDSAQGTVSNNRTVVDGMDPNGHVTRTLLLSQKEPGMLMISHGSGPNVDPEAEDITTGISQIRAFNLTNATEAYSYNDDGLRLGWGLRNSVGIAEHPVTGGIYSVENSVDQLQRDGKDIHQDNPGEEMNFHGYLNGTVYEPQGSNYGYPNCFAAWGVEDIPDNANLKVGSNFAIGMQNDTVNDTYCAEQTAPRLTFQAHMAPIDIEFNNSGSEGWVTFRGSWDRDDPVGYKLAVIPFENGEPIAASDNKTATVDILKNQDNSRCPDNCFRPVGIAFDGQGRLFMTSDASGELYVVSRAETGGGATGADESKTGGQNGGSDRGSMMSTSLALFAIVVALVSL